MNKKTTSLSFQDLYPLIEAALSEDKSFRFTAFGTSMRPFIQGGEDRVTLGPLSLPYQKNDIFLRKRKGT